MKQNVKLKVKMSSRHKSLKSKPILKKQMRNALKMPPACLKVTRRKSFSRLKKQMRTPLKLKLKRLNQKKSKLFIIHENQSPAI